MEVYHEKRKKRLDWRIFDNDKYENIMETVITCDHGKRLEVEFEEYP